MNVEPTIGLAFLAGLVSFISPCVLPLVPAYVGYMGGQATTQASSEARGRFSTFLHGIFFVLGFTIFFVGFGLLTAAASQTLTKIGIDIPTILTRLGGVAVILFGLYVMKALDPVFRYGLEKTHNMGKGAAILLTVIVVVILFAYLLWAFDFYATQAATALGLSLIVFLLIISLFRKSMQEATILGDFWYRAIGQLQIALITDTRRLEIQSSGGYLGSLGIGLVFAAGWTPCIGPIYGSVLTLAADSAAGGASLFPAGTMLTAYSLGLGIPFLVTAFALNQMTDVMRGLKRNMRKIEYVSGALLIFIGLLVLTGSLQEISSRFGNQGVLGDLSVRVEACTAGAADGRIHVSSWFGCLADGAPKLNDRLVFAALRPTVAEANEELESETSSSEIPTLSVGGGSAAASDRLVTSDPDFDPSSVEEGMKVGMLAPDFTTVTPDGQEISLSDFRGNIVLLNFWATWCGPCRTEMPEFQNIYEQFSERGFTILAMDFLETPDAVTRFAEELNLTFPLGMDESGAINDSYGIAQYPTSYVLDGNGVIVAVHAGPFLGEQLLEVLATFEPENQTGG
jgi:cytochrome c-type biogenesis protein